MNTEEKTAKKTTAAKKETLPPDVALFKEFAAYDVGPYLEEKPNGNKKPLRYLSWPKALSIVSANHSVSFSIVQHNADGIEVQEGEHGYPFQALAGGEMGYMVVTEVTIDGITKRAFLPVMDAHQYPVKNTAYKVTTKFNSFYVPPLDALVLNKNIMRCLTKNIALFGLGLYVYAGEDLPETDEIVEAPQAPKPEPAPKATPKQTVKAAPKQETVAKAEPKPAPKPAPEPEPEDDEIEIIDATTGEVLDTPKVMGTEKKEKKLMTLEEAKAYVPVQANPKVKGVPLGKLFESDVYTPKGALGVLNYYVKNSEVPGDKEAAGVLLAAMNIGDFLPEGVTLQKDETGKTVLVAEDVKKAAPKAKGSKKKETATAEQA